MTMTFRRTWVLPIVGLAVLTVLVACGGGGSSPSGSSSSGSSSSVVSTPSVTYTVGGTVSGLSGTVVLQNNAGNDLTVSANGSFAFTTALTSGSAYAVSVKTQPSTTALAQTCTVATGSGSVASSNVTSIAISCATTTINGLAVPPDPSEAGKATLAGIDTNANGIRDDIDVFIATKYGANATATKAARTSALGHQKVIMVDASNQASARIALQESGDAGQCAGIAFRSIGTNSTNELRQIYFRMYNTPERLAKHKSVSAAAGLFEGSITSVVCP